VSTRRGGQGLVARCLSILTAHFMLPGDGARDKGGRSGASRRASARLSHGRDTDGHWPGAGRWAHLCYDPQALFNGHSVGAWRSLVARIVRDDEVVGSNPAAPTTQSLSRAVDPDFLRRRARADVASLLHAVAGAVRVLNDVRAVRRRERDRCERHPGTPPRGLGTDEARSGVALSRIQRPAVDLGSGRREARGRERKGQRGGNGDRAMLASRDHSTDRVRVAATRRPG
jgi:hypothetical protein